jgi:hypothetical protein
MPNPRGTERGSDNEVRKPIGAERGDGSWM